MNSPTVPETLRRSSRVPFALPIFVTSLEPSVHFSELCETLVVNAHGCAVRSPSKLDVGVPVHIHHKEGRQTTAYVVDCKPLGTDHKTWLVAAQLDQPENFWGLKPCPEDWMRLSSLPAPNGQRSLKAASAGTKTSLKVVPYKGQEQFGEERVRMLFEETLGPLRAEVIELREKLGRPEGKRSSFEVSLSQIPPELEEQLWIRLRKELGDLVLVQSRQQAEQVLATAKTTIEQNIQSAQDEFQQRATQELQMVEVRAKRLSDEIDDGVREQLHSELENFQHHALQARVELDRRSDEFFQALQRRLGQENDARLREIEQVQAAISSESSHLEALVADLGGRVATLDQSTRQLESGLTTRLGQLSSEVVAAARARLDQDVEAILTELQERSAKELGNQLDIACGRLKMIQKGIETEVSELLNTQVARTLHAFDHTVEERAGTVVARWRHSLAKDLSSVARILGDEVRQDSATQGPQKS
jgi:hypothetical protein